MIDRWATFDCYGTLVDWPGGVRETMLDVWPDADGAALLESYMRIEPCLLYTSPSPRDGLLSRMPSSA